jgi:threonine dehydratase
MRVSHARIAMEKPGLATNYMGEQLSLNVTLGDIRAAAEAIRGSVVETPCVQSQKLSEITGVELSLKLENLQFTGSFKDRGALVRLLALTDAERAHGVVAMSAGNHAQAVAYHAQRLGIAATIVMPRYTPNIKTEHTRHFGAEVILHGETLAEAEQLARQLTGERGLILVHPYDDPHVIAGQGTIALEMLEACPDLEVLIIPIGGGGLIAGCAIAARAIKPGIEIIGVETRRFPSMQQALAGKPPKCGKTTLADGIAVKIPGQLTLPVVRALVDRIDLVDEADIEAAVLLLMEAEKMVAEGAGATGLAALLANRESLTGRKVGLVISGGNIDLPILSSIIQRGLVHSGRLVRIHVNMRDVPGMLAEVSACIGNTGANIVQVLHQRTFTTLPVQFVLVEFMLQTRGSEHVREIMNTLEEAGYTTQLSEIVQ